MAQVKWEVKKMSRGRERQEGRGDKRKSTPHGMSNQQSASASANRVPHHTVKTQWRHSDSFPRIGILSVTNGNQTFLIKLETRPDLDILFVCVCDPWHESVTMGSWPAHWQRVSVSSSRPEAASSPTAVQSISKISYLSTFICTSLQILVSLSPETYCI